MDREVTDCSLFKPIHTWVSTLSAFIIAILNKAGKPRRTTYKHKTRGPSLYFSQTDSSRCLISSSYTQTHKHTSVFCSITFKWSWNQSLGNFARHKQFDWNTWKKLHLNPPRYDPFFLKMYTCATICSPFLVPHLPRFISSEHISGRLHRHFWMIVLMCLTSWKPRFHQRLNENRKVVWLIHILNTSSKHPHLTSGGAF